jgi:hypothetical protein
MRTLLTIVLTFIIGAMATAGETRPLPKWKARIKLEGKGASVEVTVEAKDKTAARKLIKDQHKDCVFTSGPSRAKE